MCSILTQGAVATDLYIAFAAPGHLPHHCLVLSLMDHIVKCDCASLQEQPVATRLLHGIGNLVHYQESHIHRLVVHT